MNSRKSSILFAFICGAILLLSGCRASSKVELISSEVEAGKVVRLTNYIRVKDEYADKYSISGCNVEDDFSTLGEHKVTYYLKNDRNGHTESFDVTLKVVDTTGPVIKQNKNTVAITKKKFAITDFISAEDAYDGTISNENISYEGDINLKKPGKYKITVKATDNSGNESQKNVLINVISNKGSKKAFIKKITGVWLHDVSSAKEAKKIAHGEYGDSGYTGYTTTWFFEHNGKLYAIFHSGGDYYINLKSVSADLKKAKGTYVGGDMGNDKGTITFNLGPSGDQIISYVKDGKKVTCAYTGFKSYDEYQKYWDYY